MEVEVGWVAVLVHCKIAAFAEAVWITHVDMYSTVQYNAREPTLFRTGWLIFFVTLDLDQQRRALTPLSSISEYSRDAC